MAPYTAAHADPQGEGDARPTALQIIKDASMEGRLSGKVIVITGATSGIGLETARALKTTGATLILTARDLDSARVRLNDMLDDARPVALVQMDHASLSSVRAAARDIVRLAGGKINILVGNAGIMGVQELQLSDDGHELHFQTNYLSHFLLFELLKPALLAAASPALHSRVVIVSSSAHRAATLPASDDYDFQKGGYDHGQAYARSKLAEVYLANHIDRLYGAQGLHATSIHPGAINTNIGRYVGDEMVQQIMSNPFVLKVLKSHAQGAATTVLAAVGPEWESIGGKYLEDCEEAKRGADDGEVFGVGWVKQTYDQKEEERLWSDSLQMVGLSQA